MKHIFAVVLSGFAISCGAQATDASEESGSRTHWLSKCSTTSTCGGSLFCEDSRCQHECSEPIDCVSLGDNAQCVRRGVAETDPSWCQAACDSSDDCAVYPELECVNSLCQESSSPPFDPCVGKECGETCRVCDPTDSTCVETAEPKACDQNGRCSEPNNIDCDGDIPCSAVNPESCAESGCYEAVASPSASGSSAELQIVGCIETDTVCAPGEFCGLDGDGDCWRFVNSCVPVGFEEVACGDPACAAR